MVTGGRPKRGIIFSFINNIIEIFMLESIYYCNIQSSVTTVYCTWYKIDIISYSLQGLCCTKVLDKTLEPEVNPVKAKLVALPGLLF